MRISNTIMAAASMLRGRSSRRSKGRYDSGDAEVPLDLNRDMSANIRDILVNLAKEKGVSRGKKLGHLNNFVTILNTIKSVEELRTPLPEIVACLRLPLIHSAKEVRGAGLRALRYLLRDEATLQVMLDLQVDMMVMRCLDTCLANDVERVQALRFIRRLISIVPSMCPMSFVHTLVSIANDGEKERDRMLRASLATLCELAVRNTEAFSQASGLATLIRNILDAQQLRINESVMLTVLHLLNHPHTRRYIRMNVDLEQVIAPYTDFHYRHTGDQNEQHSIEEKESRYTASRMAIVTLIRSWPGMIRLCSSDATGLHSLLEILCIPNDVNRRHLLELLYDIFYLPIPDWTDNFPTALQSIDPCQMRPSWVLAEGFVVAEGKTILPHRATTRTNLTENQLALILLAFTNAGLLESLVEVITAANEHLSIMATLLLGELLHMADLLLPPECEQHHHCLPTLMSLAASFDVPTLQRNRASAAVSNLDRLHELKKRGPVPCSLFLNQILSSSESYMSERKHDRIPKDKLAQYLGKDTDELVTQAMVKDTLVLSVKDHISWNWELVGAVIKVISMKDPTRPLSPMGSSNLSPMRRYSVRSRSRSLPHSEGKRGNVSLKKFEDANINRFFRRLVDFYKPTSKQFSTIELGSSLTRPSDIQHYSVIGCQLIDFLIGCDEVEAHRLLSDLAQDIADCLMEITLSPSSSMPSEAVFSYNSITTTLSQDYFLLIGQIARSLQGERILEKVGTFQYMLDLCTADQNDSLLKLIVTSLQCSRDTLGRTVLSKVLKSTSDSMRLYATSHLRVLLRAQIPYFQIWGMELLVEQLYDKCRGIADEALDIIEEACEDDAHLHSLVQIRPSLLHMGDKGALLLTRFLSTPKGFKYLSDANFVNHELEKWYASFNRKYVSLVEMEINESFTCYKRPAQEGGFVRRSRDERKKRRDVYVLVHLYGQLVQHKAGCDLLEKQNHLPGLCDHVRYADIDTHDNVLNLKAALWALGHIGTSTWGLRLLEQETIIPEILRLAEESEVFSIRGTCFYVLGLISKTKQGAEILSSLGWECVRHTRKDFFPVLEERDHIFDETGMFRDVSPENPHSPTSTSPSPSSPIMDRSVMSCLDLESPKFIIDVASPGPDSPKGVFFNVNGSPARSPSPEPRLFLDVDAKGDRRIPTDDTRTTASLLPPKSASATQLFQKDRTSSIPDVPKYETKAESSETLYQKNPKKDDKLGPRGSILRRVQTMPAMEGPPREGRLTKFRSNSDASSKPPRDETIPERGVSLSDNVHDKVKSHLRERSQSLKNRCDSNESGRSSMGTKSRSESFATDTSQTSGVSSMYSNPSSPPAESSLASINTVTSSQTIKGVHASDTLRKRHNLKRTPSYMRRLSKTVSANYSTPYAGVLETSAVFTTVRDAHGYAALKALRMQRQHSAESVDSKPLRRPVSTSISGHELSVADRRGRMVESYSMSCIEVNQVTSHYSPNTNRSYKSGAVQSRPEYIGLCLPVDTTLIFHTDENQYRGGRKPSRAYSDPQTTSLSSPTNGPNTLAIEGPIRLTSVPSAALLPLEDNELNQFSEASQFSEYEEKGDSESIPFGGRDRRISSARSEGDAGEEKSPHAEICLFCKKIQQKKSAGDDDMDDEARLRSISETEAVADESGEQLPRARLRGSSATSGRGTPSSLEMTSTSTGTGSGVSTDSSQSTRMREDTPRGRVMIRKEVLRFVVNMSSAVGMKAQESGLLSLREKFPSTFESLCLYSDSIHLLANSNYRLAARRFIQELFQDVTFSELFIEVQDILGIQEGDEPD